MFQLTMSQQLILTHFMNVGMCIYACIQWIFASSIGRWEKFLLLSLKLACYCWGTTLKFRVDGGCQYCEKWGTWSTGKNELRNKKSMNISELLKMKIG